MNELPTTPPRLDPAPDLDRRRLVCRIRQLQGLLALQRGGPHLPLFSLRSRHRCSAGVGTRLRGTPVEFERPERLVAGLTPEALSKNEAFVSALAQATQSAMKTNSEKLEALRNAVLNIALGNSPADDLQAIFLNLVDSFTTVHLQLLRLYLHPNSWIETGFGESVIIQALWIF